MRLAYADPPYLGYGKYYLRHHPAALDWDDLQQHAALIRQLEQFDGWALSMTSGNLHQLLPLVPSTARVAAWVKPFAAFKRNVSPSYTWEPVIFSPARRLPVGAVRDHLAASITMRKGLTGAKPPAFNSWVLDLIGWQVGDTLDDLFPGTGGMGETVARRTADAPAPLGEFDLWG